MCENYTVLSQENTKRNMLEVNKLLKDVEKVSQE